MRRIMTSTTLYVCRNELQEDEEAKHLEMTLAEDEFAYHGNVGHAGSSMSISSPSSSVLSLSTSILGPFKALMILVLNTPTWIL